MKILIFNQHVEDFIGGSEIQCDLIAKNLSKYGHKIIYGVINSKKLIYNSNYDTIPLQNPSFFALNNMLKKVNPELVYWRFDRNSLLYIGILCHIYKIKLVFSISSVNDTKKWGFSQDINSIIKCSNIKDLKFSINFILNLLLRRINYNGYYFVDGLISLSRELLWEIPSKDKFLSKRITIYNSMESTVDYEFKWGRPYIIWVANLKKVKNPELYIRAADQLTDLPIDFLMVGKIQDTSYNYVNNQSNLPNNFHYLGSKEPNVVNSIIRKSLFVVHTCDKEGFGNIFIQSWLQGKPTVTLFFDPDHLIQEKKIGFLSEKFEQFCKDIRTLVDNEKLRKDMGNRAELIAKDLFSPEINTRKVESFFTEIINNKK